MRPCGYARCKARKSHDRVGNEVPVSCIGRRCRATGAGIAAGNPRAHAMTIYAGAINRDHVHMLIGIPPLCQCLGRCSISRAPTNCCRNISRFANGIGVSISGSRLLGCHEWQRDGRGVEEIHRGSKARGSRRQLQNRLTSSRVGPWGRLNPALSRNPKPPPFRRWSFTA